MTEKDDDLSRLPFAIALSRAAHAVTLQNLWVAEIPAAGTRGVAHV